MTTAKGSEHFGRRLLRGGGPLFVWALHFFGSYVLVAAGCCSAFAEAPWFGISALRAALWGLSALAAVAIVALVAGIVRRPHGLLRSAGLGCGTLALIGVAWTTLPTLGLVPLCLCQP